MSPKKRRSHRSLRLPKVTVSHRGSNRSVVLELDSSRGQICIRLSGCRTRRVYSIKDLWNWKVPQLQLPLAESDIRPSELLSEEEVLQGFAELRKQLAATPSPAAA